MTRLVYQLSPDEIRKIHEEVRDSVNEFTNLNGSQALNREEHETYKTLCVIAALNTFQRI